MTYRIETVDVLGKPMEVFLFEPTTPGPHAGIVLVPHIPVAHTGLENDPVTIRKGERYAEAGYTVAAPFIYHWWPKTDDIDVKRKGTRDDWTAADCKAAHDLLGKTPGVDAARIGIVGHCWGGRMSWLGAGTDSRYKACAVFYGGRIKVAMGEGQPPPIELAGNIPCPVIGFFGNDDENPSPADVDDLDAALKKAGVEHVFHRYDGAGHAFQTFDNPDRYRHEASEDAWEKVLAFMKEKLG